MLTFVVVGVPGTGGTASDGSGSFMGLPLRQQLEIKAEDRAMAFVYAHRYWSSQGLDVAARAMGAQRTGRDNHPLGFSESELQTIRDEGISIRSDFPEGDGVQVEDIYEKTDQAV